MTTRLSDMLNVIRFHVPIPVDFNTAGTADEEPVLIAPIACTVTGVTLVPETAITGHATNYATLSLENKGAAGTGTDEVASFAFDTPTTDDVVAFDGKALTLNATPANLDLALGDVVSIKKAIAAAGMVLDGFVLITAAPLQ